MMMNMVLLINEVSLKKTKQCPTLSFFKVNTSAVKTAVTFAGLQLNPDDMYPVLEMFLQLLNECSEFNDKGEEPMPSMGEFLRSKVLYLFTLKTFKSQQHL